MFRNVLFFRRVSLLWFALIAFACTNHSTITGPVNVSSVHLLSATSTCVHAGDTLGIIGTGFDSVALRDTMLFPGASALRIAATGVAARTVKDTDTIFVRVPTGARSGMLIAHVAATFDTLKNFITVDTLAIPVVNNFSPSSGPSGSLVTIFGKNFSTTSGTVAVNIGDAAAAVIALHADSIIVRALGGTGAVIVQQGCSSVSAAGNFVVTPRTISITSFHPTFGLAGTTIDTIDGNGFGSDTAGVHVLFGSAAATILSVTPTRIIAIVPANAITALISVHIFSDSIISNTSFRIFPPRIFSTILCTSYHVPAVLFSSGSDYPPQGTVANSYLSFPLHFIAANSTDSFLLSDTLSFAYSSGPIEPTYNNSTINITCVLDSLGTMIRWLKIISSDHCSGCTEPQESNSADEMIVLRNVPLTAASDGSRVGEVDGAAAMAAIDTCSYSSHLNDRMVADGTGLQSLRPAEDSTYFRVVLK